MIGGAASHTRPVSVTAFFVGAVGLLATGCFGLGSVVRSSEAEDAANESATHFLNRYVDDSGRVVRRDQGDDTVSEGQAYGLLLAVAVDDHKMFDLIWRWTHDHLQRRDKLFSWHWDSRVTDPQSASDADLDTARALVLAARTFDDPELSREGVEVGKSVLDRSTVMVSGHRILLPGPWAKKDPPIRFNASYVSPVATQQLYEASADRRWRELERGSRWLVRRLSAGGVPPDWAEVGRDGSVRPDRPGSGWDADRVPIRHAESCVASDRRLAASLSVRLDRVDSRRALDWMAEAAARAAAGEQDVSMRAMSKATDIRKEHPTYYGDAWEALGRFMLLDDRLGGCPS